MEQHRRRQERALQQGVQGHCLDYHGDRIDFYKNVMNPNVFHVDGVHVQEMSKGLNK